MNTREQDFNDGKPVVMTFEELLATGGKATGTTVKAAMGFTPPASTISPSPTPTCTAQPPFTAPTGYNCTALPFMTTPCPMTQYLCTPPINASW